MDGRLTLILAAALLAVPLTGCLGVGEDTDADEGLETKSRADVSQNTGGIEGLVTDEAVQPIPGITVGIVELGQTTETAEDGSFAFSNLQPGTYTLNITADGFISTEQSIEVVAGQVATVEIVLAHAPTVQPFSQQFELQGFLECSVRAVVGVAVCAIPNSLVGGNATNDRFLFAHSIERNAWQMVSEMTWEPNQPLAERMTLIVEPLGIANDNRVTFAEVEQAGPIIMNTDRGRFAEVVQNLTAICEGEMDPPAGSSGDAYCNRPYLERGGDLQLRVFVEGINEIQGFNTVGLAVQQDYTVFNTIFYNTPACEEYSLVEGNTCDQQAEPPEDDPAEEIGNRT